MAAELKTWIIESWWILNLSNGFIYWNLFLAFIPLFLSVWLFRLSAVRSIFWWIVFLIFILFLPNAPYVLTDIIHLINLIRRGLTVWIVSLVLIPQYIVFILAGFEAYVISVINLGYYLQKRGLSRYILLFELATHALSSLGIYLGRFQRFNSWDFLNKPDDLIVSSLENITQKFSLFVIFITFIVLTILYWIMKQVTLGLILRYREVRGR
jgi:uncharacterized membrane protein